MKTITSLALLGLAFGFEDDEFVITTKPLRPHPTPFHPFKGQKGIAFEDDYEFAFLAANIAQRNQRTLTKKRAYQNVAQLDDEGDNELFSVAQLEENNSSVDSKPENFKSLMKNVIEMIREVSQVDDINDNELLLKDPNRKGNSILNGLSHIKHSHSQCLDDLDDEDDILFDLGNLIQDGLNLYSDIKKKDYENLVDDTVKAIKDIKIQKKFLGF